jgi:hypothetical protein
MDTGEQGNEPSGSINFLTSSAIIWFSGNTLHLEETVKANHTARSEFSLFIL